MIFPRYILIWRETMSENKGMLSEELERKLEKLKKYIADLGSLAVGFSGGVDSSLLTAVAHEVLGERLIAVTGADASVPEREVNEATEDELLLVTAQRIVDETVKYCGGKGRIIIPEAI